jgi:F5/8 type C domain-containing protein
MRYVNLASGFKYLGFFLIFVLFMSSIRSGYSVTDSDSCSQTQVMKYSASGSEPNFPASAVGDHNDQTIWSTYGKGSWVQLDLGTLKTVCGVEIQWYKGDQRHNNFAISASKDGSSFKDIVDSKSKESTSSIDLEDLKARYIKITVNGNTQNNYASIAEVKINAIPSENEVPVKQVGGRGISNDCSNEVKVSEATAFGHYRNYVPSNAIDNNPNSRWVNEKNPSSITLDLGGNKRVCGLDIQWFSGETRTYDFTVSVSTDNKKYEVILKDKSRGSTSDAESYVTPDVNARYVRVTVNGNNENNFASINEINIKTPGLGLSSEISRFDEMVREELNQGGLSEAPNQGGLSEAPNQGGLSEAPNQGGLSDKQGTSEIPSKGTDGIQMIYPTAPGGETWFFNPNNPEDGQFDENGANIEKNADGSWHVPPGTTRMDVFTKSAGLLSDQQRSNFATYDYSELARVGYWLQPSDWKNIEVTGYFKVTSTSSGDGLSFVSRSVRHSNSVQDGCGGSSYHNNIRFDGTFQYKKEMWHVNYDILPPTKDGIGSIMDKWVGFKGIVYNLPDGSVKLESYVDKDNNNHWEKVQELVDVGEWGDDMTHCNAESPGAVITWGSPMIIFKSTGVTYDFKNLSIREIVPPQ